MIRMCFRSVQGCLVGLQVDIDLLKTVKAERLRDWLSSDCRGTEGSEQALSRGMNMLHSDEIVRQVGK